MIKILDIGNSFSRDAMYYLAGIGAADSIQIRAVNLFVPGCGLERHWENIKNDNQEYIYEENGYITEKKISVRQALELDQWDYIVTQQSSGKSGLIDTYFPFLERIVNYVKDYAEGAEILLHQTWAFEKNYQDQIFRVYQYDQKRMYDRLTEAYQNAAEKLHLRMIPCGDIIQRIRGEEPFVFERGGRSLCRDGRHMDYPYGRYTLGAVWYRFLTGSTVSGNGFIPETDKLAGQTCDMDLLRLIQQTVDEYI